jgi:hypothetical protein
MNLLVRDLKRYYKKNKADLSEINYFFPCGPNEHFCSNFISWISLRSIFIKNENVIIPKEEYTRYNIPNIVLTAIDTKMFTFIELKKNERIKGNEEFIKKIIIPNPIYSNYGYIPKYEMVSIDKLILDNGVII